jgi:guanylate kinase
VYRALISDGKLGLKGVVTYTTRPRREGETEGTEYHFITDGRLETLKKEGRVIELRVYNTVRGAWSYCTVDDGQIDLAAGNYLMIVTLDSYKSLVDHYGRGHVTPIYLYVEDGLRLERALERERSGGKPEYEEMCRRFLADAADFSEERLKYCGILSSFKNIDLKSCVEQISDEILHQIM